MKLVLLECKKCGAKLKVKDDSDRVVCDYCGAEMLLVDENQTEMERLIKTLGKELSRSQERVNFYENKKAGNFQKIIPGRMIKAISLFILIITVLIIIAVIYVFLSSSNAILR